MNGRSPRTLNARTPSMNAVAMKGDHMDSILARAFVILAALTFSPFPLAPAEGAACKAVSKLPVRIEKPGSYCITKDLTVPAAAAQAIEIASDDVTLDLGGFTLHGPGLPDTTTVGIAGVDRRNVTIRNGGLDGFLVGVQLLVSDLAASPSAGHLVEALHVDRSRWIGIQVQGRSNVVRRNHVLASGGSTAPVSSGNAFGIAVSGAAHQIYDNDVLDTIESTGVARAIQVDSGPLCTIERNHIANVGAPAVPNGLRKGTAITVRFSPGCIIVSNRMNGAVDIPIDTTTVASPPDDYAYCRDNIARNAVANIFSAACVNGGGNYP